MILSWFRSWWPGYPHRESALDLFVWRARRSGMVCWMFLGLVPTILLAGTTLALLPTPDIAPIVLPGAPVTVAVDGHAGRLYVATADDRVWVLGSADQRVVGSADVGDQPVAVAADSDSGRAYAATVHGLTVLTAGGATVGPTIDLGQPPTALAVDPALHRLYATTVAFDHDAGSGSLSAGSVVVLDTVRDAVVERVAVGVSPLGIAVDPRSHRVYVAAAGDERVDVLGGSPLSVQASIPVVGEPHGISIDPQAGRVYVTDDETGNLAVLDAVSDTVRATVPVGLVPAGVAVDPVSRRVFVADGGEGTIAVFHSPGATPLITLRVGDQPASLAVDTASGRLYVTDVAGGSIWLIQDHRFGLPTARLFARTATPASATDGQVSPG